MKRRIKKTIDDHSTSFNHLMQLYGFFYDPLDETYTCVLHNRLTDGDSFIKIIESDPYVVTTIDKIPAGLVSSSSIKCDCVEALISYIDDILQQYHIDIMMCGTSSDQYTKHMVVLASISARDLSKNLVRVKSSNVWAYTINIRDNKAKTGDVLCQFKGKNGGPGDIYMYFDVPLSLWRKWLSAPSKGHFFWAYIRNNFYYRKLTGNKRGVLKNAVN